MVWRRKLLDSFEFLAFSAESHFRGLFRLGN
jgi:hypothetical protein